MVFKRKRSRRGRGEYILSESEGADTFINNSDYLDQEQYKSSNVGESSSTASPRIPLGNVDKETVASQLERVEENQIKDLHGQNQLETNSTRKEKIQDEGRSRQDSITSEDQNSLTLINCDSLDPVNFKTANEERALPLNSLKIGSDMELSSLSSIKPPSSYSQQKSDILLLSPSKRRENTTLAPNTNEPRLVINKLILTNFKSYAGEQIIGPFNASFSAVVGPNGSGKSNVIDSLLFVFGFRALKMRQGKLSELIHNSVDGMKLDFCQVDIHFHNVIDSSDGNEVQVVPSSELVISRRANKNNSSQYFIDGKSSTYTAVTNLLMRKGVDLHHKRFLILQGEVESIAQMKAKAERENDDGLLEYLEDIIGTSQYKELIEQALLKVEELNEVCLEKENRVVLVEKDKDQLEEKKDDALKLLEAEKTLALKKSIHLQNNIMKNKLRVVENEKHVTQLNTKLYEEKESNRKLMDSVKDFTDKQASISKTISDLNNMLIPLQKKQKTVNKSKVSLEEKIKNINTKIKKATKARELLDHILTSSNHKLESCEKLISQYSDELVQLTSDLEAEKVTLDDIRKKMKDKTSQFSNEIESLQTKLEPWNDKLKINESALQLINSEIEIFQSEKESSTKHLEDARQRLLHIKGEGKSKEAELRDSEATLSQIEKQIKLGEEQCGRDKSLLDQGLQKLSALRQKTQEVLTSVSNRQNKDRVLSGLARLAKSGRIEGYYGKLGDLGVIDDKYDIAISTVCPGLSSIVVETVETAQACIDYLRKSKLGYANFICLDKLRQFNLSPIQTPGNSSTVKRIFDLIRPQSPKFAPAFYSKLYNTLVVSNLEEAKRVAYGPKRWKVVTLDGKVVDTSGTMSGGGNFSAKGGMRLSNSRNDSMEISEEEIEPLKESLRKEELNYELASSEYQEKLLKLYKLKEMKPDTEFKISKLKLDIEALIADKQEALAFLKGLLAESGAKTKDSTKLEERIACKEIEKDNLINEKKELKSQMVELEEKINALEEKIMEAGGVELRLQNSKVDSNKQKIEIISEKVSNEKMQARKLRNDISRHQKILNEVESELKDTDTELECVKKIQGEKDEEISNISSQITAIESEKESKDEELETLRNELEEKQRQINEARSAEIELDNEVEKYKLILQKSRAKLEDDEENLKSILIKDTTPYIDWLDEEERKKYDRTTFEVLSEELIKDIDIDEINTEIEELEKVVSSIKVDIDVLKEYGTKKNEFEKRRSDLNGAVEERDQLKSYCEELKRKRLDEFMKGFNTISMSLKEMYQMITMGGNAELELVDSLDPFSEGIMFSVMPPKKSWKNISNLSGGEKTLSSLALVFALHKYKPTPLYVMDEIDAALDFRNVSIVANYIKERTKNAQFVVISLRNNMFELAQQLVGIYKVNNMTKSISLQNKDFLIQA
ncbi:uncharacterized protein PRCAT00002410001 [Priceomyces carsonii]|uniref:uncharacterized protein n=1 Tax=Priceomyces carsonii TaxID=28549 RepID=UPI002ED841FC|nr:unnamed protein product [Priceomyces carsonii]